MGVKQGTGNCGQSVAESTQEGNAARMRRTGRQGALDSPTSMKTQHRGKRKLGGVVWTFGAADKLAQGRITPPPSPAAIGGSSSRPQESTTSRRNGAAVDILLPGEAGSGGSRSGDSSAPCRGENSAPEGGPLTDRGQHGDDGGDGDGNDTLAAASGSSKRQHTLEDPSDGATKAAGSLRALRRSEQSLPAVLGPSSTPIGEGRMTDLCSPPQMGSCWQSSPSTTAKERLVGNAFGAVRSQPKDTATPGDCVSQNARGATTPERLPARHAARSCAHENDTAYVSKARGASVSCSAPSTEGMGHGGANLKAAIAMSSGSGLEKSPGHRHGGARKEEEEDAALAGRWRNTLETLDRQQSKTIELCCVGATFEFCFPSLLYNGDTGPCYEAHLGIVDRFLPGKPFLFVANVPYVVARAIIISWPNTRGW